MKIDPILPIPLMAVICIGLLFLKRKGAWNYVRQIVAVLLLFTINLRILVPTDKVKVLNSNIDVVFCIDNTISMLAEDYKGDGRRIDAVKDDVADIMAEFDGARFTVMTFSDQVNYLVPFTYEQDIVIQAVDALEGQAKTTAQGTSLDLAYEGLRKLLKSSDKSDDEEDEEDIIEESEDRITVVFIISDGEITGDGKLKSFEKLAEYIDSGAVLGYGTRSGGKMRVREYALWDETSYLTYYDSGYNSVTAISKIDEGNLEQIAEDTGLFYFHMTKPKDVDEVLKTVMEDIETGEFSKSVEKRKGFAETYWIFALILAALTAYDMIVLRMRMRQEK